MNRFRLLRLWVIGFNCLWRFPGYLLACGRRPRLQNLLVKEHENRRSLKGNGLKANFLNRIVANPQPTATRPSLVVVAIIDADEPVLHAPLTSTVQGARKFWRREAGSSSADGSWLPPVADVMTERVLPIVTDNSRELVQCQMLRVRRGRSWLMQLVRGDGVIWFC